MIRFVNSYSLLYAHITNVYGMVCSILASLDFKTMSNTLLLVAYGACGD